MARESELWQRCKTAAKALVFQGHKVDLQRIENAASSGHPDVEGCIDGSQVWIELKSCDRPVRADTPIRPKKRPSQEIWHVTRSKAGSRIHWLLIQVGEDRDAAIYLIPGNRYKDITAPEGQLAAMSAVSGDAAVSDALVRAMRGW